MASSPVAPVADALPALPDEKPVALRHRIFFLAVQPSLSLRMYHSG